MAQRPWESGQDHAEAADAPRSKRKREEDLPLIDIVKHNGSLIGHAVKRLAEDYESNPESVLFQILTMLFQACGARYDISATEFYEAALHHILPQLLELARIGLVDDNYSSKDLKDFKQNLGTFWDSLVLECQNGPLFDDNLFTTITAYVIALSRAPPRVYRQVASLVGLQLFTSFISVAKTLSGQSETTERQLNAENKKQSDGPAVESLNKKLSTTLENIKYLEESMKKIFRRLFMKRFRDVDPEIRMLCIKALGIWVVSYPSVFLKDSVLKYLGWALSDENAGVRRTSILALQSLYDVAENIPSLGLFTEKFSSKMFELAGDIYISVAMPAIGLIKQLLRHQLPGDDADLFCLKDLLLDVSPTIRRAIGELFYDHLIARNCKTPSVTRDGDNESSEIHISRMLHILRRFSDEPALSSYVIDAIYDDMKAMKDWKCMISMLLDETPIPELNDMDGTNLVRMLRASAKKAVGERIIPATDNRSMYCSKDQKTVSGSSKSDITNALMKSYPQLLRKYLHDKAKISPLIDMMMLLELKMYSPKRQEQNFKDAIDLIVDAFFKHGDKDTLNSCIKAIAFCSTVRPANLLDYAQNKLKTLERELVLKVKTAIKEVEAGHVEYSLLVNLKRLHRLQLSKPVQNNGLFEDMHHILHHSREMDNEVKVFLLLDMFVEIEWCLHAIDVKNPSETSIRGILSKQSSFFELLYSFLEVLKEERNTTVLSSRVCIITAEMWCLFKESDYSSTRLEELGYRPQLNDVQKFWKLCQQQLSISDDTKDEDAKEKFIEDMNRDTLMLAAVKLLLDDVVSKDYLGPEIVSHYVSHGASTKKIIEHLITTLKKDPSYDKSALFFEALRRAYERDMLHDAEKQNLTVKSYSECQDLAKRLASYYVGAALVRKKSEPSKIIQCGVQFAFADFPNQLSFLEAALLPFASKLALSDVPDILTDVKKRAQDTGVDEDSTAWRPYFLFMAQLRARTEVSHKGKEKKRPRKTRDEPPVRRRRRRRRRRKHVSSEEEEEEEPRHGLGGFRVCTKSVLWIYPGSGPPELDGHEGIAVVVDGSLPGPSWIPIESFCVVV